MLTVRVIREIKCFFCKTKQKNKQNHESFLVLLGKKVGEGFQVQRLVSCVRKRLELGAKFLVSFPRRKGEILEEQRQPGGSENGKRLKDRLLLPRKVS